MEDRFIIYDSDTADDMDYDDAMFDLTHRTNQPVVVVADLDLWRGHKLTSSEFGCSLIPCLTEGNFDHNVLYLESNEVYKTAAHHDGTNKYLYREMKPDRTYDDFIEELRSFDDFATIDKYTLPLGGYIKQIYGL